MKDYLLDTHTLVWLTALELGDTAVELIGKAAQRRALFVSPLVVWEVGVAVQKLRPERRPNLLGLTPEGWFEFALSKSGAIVLPITTEIALEASRVPAIYGSGDPGDCFLIATARIHTLSLMTRDFRMLELARSQPEYLDATPC